MNDVTTTTTAATEEDETVKMQFDVAVPMKKGENLFDIMERAKIVIGEARKVGTVSGELVLGRKRFPLT